MNIEKIYTGIGAQFVSTEAQISNKAQTIKAYIFDWDGVFNNGQKSAGGSSNFNEVDSMGTNLLRYSYFLKNGNMPITAVISGEKNETAFWFCKREGFNYSFFKIPDKIKALDVICKQQNILQNQVAYFFDDVLDLSIAKVCGLRILVNRNSNPLFKNYCIQNNLVDYITAAQSGDFAIREATEMLVGINHNFNEVINNRTNYDSNYATYIEERKKANTLFYTLNEGAIKQVEADV